MILHYHIKNNNFHAFTVINQQTLYLFTEDFEEKFHREKTGMVEDWKEILLRKINEIHNLHITERHQSAKVLKVLQYYLSRRCHNQDPRW